MKTLKQLQAQKPSLYRNINIKKKTDTSKSKKESTVSKKAYKNMKGGFNY